MNFLGNILNGIKGALSQRAAVQPQPNIAMQPQANAQPPLTGEVTQNNPTPTTNKQNAVINALSKVSPTNWQDTTRQAIGNVLNGMLQAQYDPNLGVLGSLGRGAVQGRQNQINYMNAKNTLDSYGFDTTGMSPYIDYSTFSPEKIVTMGVQERKNRILREIAKEKDITKQKQMILKYHNSNDLSTEDAERELRLLNFKANLQDSNQTKLTDVKIPQIEAQTEYVKAKTEDVKNPKPRTTISIRKGGTKSTVDIKHNGGGGNSKSDKDPLGLWK